VASFPKVKKDANGLPIMVGVDERITTQDQADYSDILKASQLVTGIDGDRLRGLIKDNPGASAGLITSLSRAGAMPDNNLVKVLTQIDVQTREQRAADVKKESDKIATQRFNSTPWGFAWSQLKGLVRGSAVVGNTPVEALAAPFRTAVDGLGKEFNAIRNGEVDWFGNPLSGKTREELGLVKAEPFAAQKDIAKEFLGQQTVFQITKQLFDEGKVDLGSGFFPSEESGAGFAAREEQLKANKVAFKVNGQTYYRPYALLDPVAYVVTGGHPESSTARVITALGDIGVAVALDPFLAVGRLKAAKELADTISQASSGVKAAKAAKDASILKSQLDDAIKRTQDSLDAMKVSSAGSKNNKMNQYLKNFNQMAKIRDQYNNIKIDYDSIANFLSGPASAHIIDTIADISDFRKIQKLSKGRLTVDEAVALAKATTREEVLQAIAPYIADGAVIQRSLEQGTKTGRAISRLASGISKGQSVRASQFVRGAAANALNRIPISEKIIAIGRKYDAYLPNAGGTLIHVSNKDKLVETVNDIGRYMELDKTVLDNLINDIAFAQTGTKSGYDATAKLFDAIFTKYSSRFQGEELEAFKKLTRAFDTERKNTSAYWAQQHATGAEINFGLVNGKQITLHSSHLDSELLNSFVFVPSPREIKDALESASKIFRYTKDINGALSSFTGVWKKTVMVRPAYISRNIIEEQIRVFGVGHVSFFNHPLSAMAMWMGRDGGPKWKALLNKLDETRNDVYGVSLKGKTAAEDFSHETLAGELVGPYVAFMSESSMGSAGDGALNKIITSLGYQKEVYGHPSWWGGYASQMRILHNSAFVRKVLSTPTGKELDTVNFFLKGEGKDDLARFIASKDQEFKDFVSTPEGLMKYLFTGTNDLGQEVSVLARIEEMAGGGEGASLIKQLILDGKVAIGGKTIEIPNGKTIAEATSKLSNKRLTKRAGFTKINDEFAKTLQNTFDGLGNWDNVRMVVPVKSVEAARGIPGEFEKLTNWFFEKAVRFEKTTTMGPEWRQSYWDAIRDLSAGLNADAIARLRPVAEKSLLSLKNPITGRNVGSNHKVWNALDGASGKGPITLDEAHEYAANLANKKVASLFYDASKRNLLFHQMRLIFPFMQAWENTLEEWSRIALNNPLQIYKAAKVGDWASSSSSSALYELTDAKDYYDPNQGFFFGDPQTGERKFFVPFATTGLNILQTMIPGGSAARLSGPMAFSATPQSFNFALGGGSFFPGFGPGILISAAMLDALNKNPLKILPANLEEDIYRIAFPYGLPDIKNRGLIDGALLTSNWARIIQGGILGIESAYSSAFAPSMLYLANSGDYSLDDPNDQSRLVKDSDNLARYFTMWRGIFGALTPIPFAMKPEALAKSKDGNTVLATALWSDFKNLEKEAGSNKNKAYADFLDTYGPEQVFAIVRTTTGFEPTNLPTYNLIRKDPSVLDKYPDIYGTFYPNGELSQVLYKFQQMQGNFTKMSTADIMAEATRVRYKAAKDRLMSRSVGEGWEKSQYDEALKSLNESYTSRNYDPGKVDFGWQDRAITQLKLAVNDDTLVDSDALAGARAYLIQRDKALEASGMKTLNNQASAPQREWLATEALNLLKKYPDFQKIFYTYFKNELEG
jgi:hypothetical protein